MTDSSENDSKCRAAPHSEIIALDPARFAGPQIQLSPAALAYSSSSLITDVLTKIQTEISPKLYFHTHNHVLDVINEVILFGTHDKLPSASLELLAIAAAFHDFGFLERAEENEELGAQHACDVMKRSGRYSEEDQTQVRTMILDTTMHTTAAGMQQQPTTELSKYLCDADLSNLGRADFFDKLELRWLELGQPNRGEYLSKVKHFVTLHTWHTPAARALRHDQKLQNIAALDRLT